MCVIYIVISFLSWFVQIRHTTKCYNAKVALCNFHFVNVALGGKKVGDPWSSMYCILAYTAASRHMLIVNLAGIVSLACVLAYYC